MINGLYSSLKSADFGKGELQKQFPTAASSSQVTSSVAFLKLENLQSPNMASSRLDQKGKVLAEYVWLGGSKTTGGFDHSCCEFLRRRWLKIFLPTSKPPQLVRHKSRFC